ncbi:hypothetical protein SISNIDRAFT_470825 [Sistotremastrum niveocremeum HHB9708]|uniref:Uncharacterized protein n=1 Tax=Sistotremastrum niveocremeum HHB9708 TaxID=1314777 RepID=A0A164NC43_9AGAM|nr:hypothetical protein SISNIDRAFT_470825 [Sistotremastrum niveocremeum HHB9708]
MRERTPNDEPVRLTSLQRNTFKDVLAKLQNKETSPIMPSVSGSEDQLAASTRHVPAYDLSLTDISKIGTLRDEIESSREVRSKEEIGIRPVKCLAFGALILYFREDRGGVEDRKGTRRKYRELLSAGGADDRWDAMVTNDDDAGFRTVDPIWRFRVLRNRDLLLP